MSALVQRTAWLAARRTHIRRWFPRWLKGASTFEKVIVANSAIIVLDTAAGWWITQHNPETYHYLIDTGFIAVAALLGLAVNFALLRAAFAPLHSILATIRAVDDGDVEARAETEGSAVDVLVLARAFNAMLDRLEQARDDAAARVLLAQEEERRRLALELHDETGQSLTALSLHAAAIAQGLAGEPSAAAAQARVQAERLATLAQRMLAEVQALSRQLRPPLLDDLGLAAALRWLGADAEDRLEIRVRVRVRLQMPVHAQASADPDEHGEARLPTEVETALFRIAQEALTNAVRHGQANEVQMALHCDEAQVTLVIADNGAGFDAHRRSAARHGLGLEGMRERTRLLNGRLAIRTGPGRGCAIRVVAPLAPRMASALLLTSEATPPAVAGADTADADELG